MNDDTQQTQNISKADFYNLMQTAENLFREINDLKIKLAELDDKILDNSMNLMEQISKIK